MEISINSDVIQENAESIQDIVEGSLTGVVKDVAANQTVIDAYTSAGIDSIAVSRVRHLKKLQGKSFDVVMLKVPSRTEIESVVKYADVTLHGSLPILRKANSCAKANGTEHRIIPMFDAGDNREGFLIENVDTVFAEIAQLPHITIDAAGINLGCFGSPPDPDVIQAVVNEIPFANISIGGSGILPVHESLPDSITSYRIGDAILTGKWQDTEIPFLTQGAFTLHASVLKRRTDETLIDIGRIKTDPTSLVPDGDFTLRRWSNELAIISGVFSPDETVSFEMECPAIATTFNSLYLSLRDNDQ